MAAAQAGPRLHRAAPGHVRDGFKNTHVKNIPDKCLTRAWHVRGPLLGTSLLHPQRPGGLVRNRSAWKQPLLATLLRPATYFLSLGFENTARPETLAPARGRTRPATSSLECPSRSPRPPPAPEVTHTSPWVHRTLAVHFRGSPRPHVLGFAFEVRGKGAHHTSGRVFLGTGSFLAENKMEEKNSPLPARKPQVTGEAAAAGAGGCDTRRRDAKVPERCGTRPCRGQGHRPRPR